MGSDSARLDALLQRIDGRPYPAWRDLRGQWELDAFTLIVDHVQGDPFASPSRARLRVCGAVEPTWARDLDRRTATEDWLLRRFYAELQGQRRGSGRSGALEILRPGPEVVERSAVRLESDGTVEVRFRVGLPARGRRVLGREGRALLCDDLPAAASRAMAFDPAAHEAHVASICRQRSLRRALRSSGLVAFIENGSRLPRATGASQDPLVGAVPFSAPESLRLTLEGVVGMGIPTGVTALIGGGFHGKSTVLDALARGHLDHVPGDGREGVVSDPDTVAIRAEDGRPVTGVDISAFLRDLPGGRSTRPFDTDNASGSTSQAAALVEAVDSGARVLLMDEDSSATNLMVRDARMRALIPAEREPITPLVERVRQLQREWGLSTVLAIGGVGDWLGVADTVIAMEDWVARDASQQARELGIEVPESTEPLRDPLPRVPTKHGLEPGKLRARDRRSVQYGDAEIDLVAVTQVLGADQAWTLGQALAFLHDTLVDGHRPLPVLLDALEAILDDEGIEALSPRGHPDGGLVRPRRHEIAAALNRLRTLTLQS